MPSVKVSTKQLKTAPVVVSVQLVRRTSDYERDTLTAVYAIDVPGLPRRTEVSVEYSITDLRKQVLKQDDDINLWLMTEAQRRGVIPAGTVA